MPGFRLKFGDFSQDQGLVGGLLGILGKQDGPAGVQSRVDVIMTTMDIEGVFGERPGRHFHNHGGQFPRCVIVLLQPVDNPLARSKIDHPLSRHRGGDSAPLGGMLTFGFDGDFGIPENREFTLGIRELEVLPHFGAGSNGIENPRIGQPGLSIVGHQLISVGRDRNAGIFRLEWFDPAGLDSAALIVRFVVGGNSCHPRSSISCFKRLIIEREHIFKYDLMILLSPANLQPLCTLWTGKYLRQGPPASSQKSTRPCAGRLKQRPGNLPRPFP